MIFLKSFSFLVFNLLIGLGIVLSIKAFFFFPRKKHYAFGHHVPLTPGLLYRKKTALIDWLKFKLHEYFTLAGNRERKGYISRWEQSVYDMTWEKLEFIENAAFLPRKIRAKLHHLAALFFYEIARQFFRSFIPYLLNRYQAEKYIVILDQKLDMEVVRDYYNKYVNRILLLFFLGVNFIIGLINMIWFVIVH